MTKDLALLVGDKQSWLTTEGFLDKIDENSKKAMGGLKIAPSFVGSQKRTPGKPGAFFIAARLPPRPSARETSAARRGLGCLCEP